MAIEVPTTTETTPVPATVTPTPSVVETIPLNKKIKTEPSKVPLLLERPEETEAPDIDAIMEFATTPPEVAVKNIDRANLFDLPPDEYHNLSDGLNAKAEAIERVNPTRGVAEYMKKSQQHASAVKEDGESLNWMDSQIKYMGTQIFDLPEASRDMSELGRKFLDHPEQITDTDKQLLESYFGDVNTLGEESYGLEGGEKAPAIILGAVGDMIRGVAKHKTLVASIVGANTLALGAVGALTPVPGATLVGATTGAIEGSITATMAVGFWDSFQETRGSLYAGLTFAKDENGQPLNISESTKSDVAHGVAFISGAASMLVSRTLMKSNPFFQKLLSPKLAVKLFVNPSLKLFGQIIKDAGVSGGAAQVVELTKIFGEEFAKSEKTELGFNDFLNKVTSPESLERLKKAGLIGAGTGATISAGLSLPGYFKNVKTNKYIQSRLGDDNTIVVRDDGTWSVERISRPQTPKDGGGAASLSGPDVPFTPQDNINKSVKALNTQDSLNEISAVLQNTKLKKLAPNEANTMVKTLFTHAGITDNFWLNIEDLRQLADSPERGEFIRSKIDPRGVLASEKNAPIPLAPETAIELITEFPEIGDYLRNTPEAPNPKDSKVFLERMLEAKGKRSEKMAELGVDRALTPEQLAEMDKIVSPVEEARKILTQQEYFDEPTFPQDMESFLPKGDLERINKAQLDARLATAKYLRNEVDNEFLKLENELVKIENQKDIEYDLESLQKEFAIIEKFSRKNNTEFANDLRKSHKKPGHSPYAIDPKFLPEDLREAYLTEPNLKKQKVFVEGGITLGEAAAIAGVDSGEELLRILANTPTKNQVINNRDQRKIAIRNRIQQDLKPTKIEASDEIFTNQTKAHINEMNFLKDERWSATKTEFVRIALPNPTLSEVRGKAEAQISVTPIKDLDYRQWAAGERSSQAQAVKHIVKNERFKAWTKKGDAALNSELTRATINAKLKVKQAEKFLKKLNSPELQQELKDAGNLDAITELLDVYKLDLSKKGLSEKGSYNRYVEKQVKAGAAAFEIPERFNDVRESANEMTVEQYLAVTDFAKNIVHQSKMKNKLYNKFEAKAELQTVELIAETFHDYATSQYNYDVKKAYPASNSAIDVLTIANRGLEIGKSTFKSMKHIIEEVDGDQLGGLLHTLVGDKVKKSRTAARTEASEIEKLDKEIWDKFGDKNFRNDIRDIAEFADFPALGYGKVRKSELYVMFASMGDPGGRQGLNNFTSPKGSRLSSEDILAVLERELDEKDALFVQNFMIERWKRFTDRSFALHEKTTGITPTMVKGVSFIHRGKVITGGYYPKKLAPLTSVQKAEKYYDRAKEVFKNLGEDVDNDTFAKMRASEMTDQGRLQERTGSQRAIDLNFDNIFNFTEQMVHDLHFRETGIDSLKILKHPSIQEDIKALVGPVRFDNLLDSLKDVISKSSEEGNITVFGKEFKGFTKVVDKIHSLHAIKAIGANLTSAMVQFDSIATLSLRMGPTTPWYIAKTAKMLAANPGYLDKFIELAEEYNPDLKLEKDGIDHAVTKHSYTWIPAQRTFFKNYNNSAKNISRFKEFQENINDASFFMVRENDRMIKTLATLSLIQQFINGHVKGYPSSVIDKMSDSEKIKTAKSVIQQAADLSLTSNATEDKTPSEKNVASKLFVRYFTDPRNRLNTIFMMGRKSKRAWKQKEYSKAAGYAAWTALVIGMSNAFINLVRQKDDSILEEIEKIEDADTAMDFAKDTAWSFTSAPFTDIASTLPGVNGVFYAASKDIKSDYRSVTFPFTDVLTDIATGAAYLGDALALAVTDGEFDLPSDIQRKALLSDSGYLIGGAFTNAIYKIASNYEDDLLEDTVDGVTNIFKRTNKSINNYVEKFKDVPEAKEFIEDLKTYQKENLPQYDTDVKKLIPENAKETLKQSLSEGKWNKQDPDTGAAGIYQFTESKWNEIKDTDPSLGLTDNGRVAKDSSQQEKAMNWVIQDNTRGLLAYGIPVDEKTLLGAHLFGVDSYSIIHNANGNDKLAKVLDNKTMEDPIYKNFKTVKSVRDYLAKQIDK